MREKKESQPGEPLVAAIDDLRAVEKKKQEMLADLLEEKLRDEGQILAIKSSMGNSVSYHGTASMRWVAEKIILFTQLPMFKKKVDPETGNLEVNNTTVEELRQRAPHWSRQWMLTYYLLRQPARMFPPMLVVITEAWVDKPKAPEWGKDGRATRSSMPLTVLDRSGEVVLIDFRRGVTAYVIDGAHRLLGIKGVMEIVREGRFTLKNPSGKSVKTRTLDDLNVELNLQLSQPELNSMADEGVGIQFVPAMMKGETYDEARVRIRSIFVHVNKTAQPPTYGEQVLLDEDDGFAILARRVGLSHPLLEKVNPGDRVNWKSTSLPAGSKWLTSGSILRDMAAAYLGGKSAYSSWVAKRREIPLRPHDSELKEGEEELKEFLNRVARLPSFAGIVRGDSIDSWREFPTKGKGHLLMRPLGQLILADAVGFLHQNDYGPQLSLDVIFRKLERYDRDGGFEGVHTPKSNWYGITFDPVRKQMSMPGRKTGSQLLRYLLHELPQAERSALLEEYQILRTIRKSEHETSTFDYDGSEKRDPKDVKLPPMI